MHNSTLIHNVKLSSPWAQYYEKVKAMFGDDPEIKIVFDEENYILKLFVDNTDKADAIQFLLPPQVVFGNVVLEVQVIPPKKEDMNILDIFDVAFKGNPALDFTNRATTSGGGQFNYVVFKKEVVQFFNDSLADISGRDSTLFQDIAADIFKPLENVHYCTNCYSPIPLSVRGYHCGDRDE